MKCPYCISELDPAALVCFQCRRDIYLVKTQQEKIAQLEAETNTSQALETLTAKIAELEAALASVPSQMAISNVAKSPKQLIGDGCFFILLPLFLLLCAHVLITIVYDAKPLYLHVISMTLPLPFGFVLFKSSHRSFPGWFTGVMCLSLGAVVGMSAITSAVDGTPLWPQNLFEWRELIQYAASIGFSFSTGMLLGALSYSKHLKLNEKLPANPVLALLLRSVSQRPLSPEKLHALMKRMQDFYTTAMALAATAMTLYTGLKGVFNG